ncbi:hypothetical protein [Geoalkalibacter subterraneus]|jgi:hypothetical protein|uniref:hypothetical protein n=1 Tax=Geoalkalibacter subterraneus TaxID=483547 RepID=UPI0006943D17|nr:hypothetical protein [Geoalkalibacter subterraneus]
MTGSKAFKFESIALGLIFFLTISLAGCGTLIYPERRGQSGGRIDPAIAILDGVGLLVFLIPGMIAFAVDFATGAIYLPGSSHAALDGDKMTIIELPDSDMSPEALREIIEERTGYPISFHHPQLEAYRVENAEDIRVRLGVN